MDYIAAKLGLNPLSQTFLNEITEMCNMLPRNGTNISPFNSEWFKPIRVENGKNSNLVKSWNGSEQQKEFLRRTLKNRKITWGNQITTAKSHGPYSITVNGQKFTTLSINKFAREHSLNFSSLRNSLYTEKSVKSKNRTVTVTKILPMPGRGA
jgi:hypothetical protein